MRAQAPTRWGAIVVGIFAIAACSGEGSVPSGRQGAGAPSPTVSFPPPEGAGELRETSMEIDGGERVFGLYTPDFAPAGAAPLVVLLHGPNNDLTTTLSNSGLAPVADLHGFLIALPRTSHPTGSEAQWAVARDRKENKAKHDALSGFGLDNFAAANWPFGDADADFIMATVESVETSHEVDESMVFVVGLQNGGFMAARMICDRPDRFAAVGELAAGPFVIRDCPAASSLPSFSVIPDGTLDKVSVYADDWAERNGCVPRPESRQLARDVEELAYGGCEERGDVVVHVLSKIAYPWPWPPAASSGSFGDYWPAQALWEFLSSHPRP